MDYLDQQFGANMVAKDSRQGENWAPRSPDLNPLDFSIWAAIDKKALAGHKAGEGMAAYKARLRRTALNMPRAEVRKAVEGIKTRAHAIFAADGGNIKRD